MKRFNYKRRLSQKQLDAGEHRSRVGDWKIGDLQLAFMQEQGLKPDSYLLDLGCGPLRAGTRFAAYLDAAHYYGIDINESVIEAAYDAELTPELKERLPRTNLRAVDRFECDFGVQFDYAIANSVFSHVSLNHVRLALHQVGKNMKPGGRFFTTFFEAPEDTSIDAVIPDSRRRFTERNAYWYYAADLEWAAGFGPWTYRYIGPWGHPKQNMVEFTRTG